VPGRDAQLAANDDHLTRHAENLSKGGHHPTPRAPAIAATLLPALAATAKEVALTGPQISAAISGKYVTDEYHWGHRYFADGRVERSENGRQRTARWSVKGNRLCLLQPEVSKDEPICYSVTRDG